MKIKENEVKLWTKVHAWLLLSEKIEGNHLRLSYVTSGGKMVEFDFVDSEIESISVK